MVRVRGLLDGNMSGSWLLLGAVAVGARLPAGFASPAMAQNVGGVLPEGVAPAPPNSTMALNAALGRLGENPRDLSALLDAGSAAMAIGDIDAAIGFFTRADQVSPGNSRVKAGLASALVLNGNPFDAIPLFAEAERAGGLDAKAQLDRGLAYDLVADNASAQRYYRQAMAAAPSDEASRRLSLSLAIAGDRRASETAIKPLLDRQDKAAWRSRAFALAILGKTDEAIGIVKSTLPADLANAIAPYMRYMPRLTPAQQAAAANFGQFPRASEIGQDDPRVASFATTRRTAVAAADTALIPRGEPLGQRSGAQESREAKRERQAREQQAAREQREAQDRAERAEREQRDAQRRAEQDRQRQLAEAQAAARRNGTALAERGNEPTVRPLTTVPGVATPLPGSAPPPRAALPAPPPAPVPAPVPATVAANVPPPVPQPVRQEFPASSPPSVSSYSLPPPAPVVAAPVPAASPAPPVPATPPPVTSAAIVLPPRPPAPQAPVAAVPAPAAARVTASAIPAPPVSRRSVADAFGDLTLPVGDSRPAAGAVDIRRIKPRVEGPAKPAPPLHPSRIWVQVATGRDRAALGFDWRRMTRANDAVFRGKKPFVSAWGQTSRLLTGPFESEAAANAFINQLRRADISAFVWTSPAGQVVDAITPK